jgi:hypothetical protein
MFPALETYFIAQRHTIKDQRRNWAQLGATEKKIWDQMLKGAAT